uniref:C2H2-type domain-containing protein n=1 Tax=Glossina palpalis gambiensis TaxID=67801 RepID=A0A1B0BY08_9MUSC
MDQLVLCLIGMPTHVSSSLSVDSRDKSMHSQRSTQDGPWGLPALLDLNTVGSNRNENNNNADPLPSGEGYQLTSTSTPTIPSTTFQCQFCSRYFTTKTGAGVHARRAHPNELDQRNARTDVKLRWSEEEELLLARKEAELIIDGKTRFMNKALAAFFPARSLEAIKKIRQKPSYRQHVERYVSSISNERLPDDPVNKDWLYAWPYKMVHFISYGSDIKNFI